MRSAGVGLLGVEQAAIMQCLIVKAGKVWQSAVITLISKDPMYNCEAGKHREADRLTDEAVVAVTIGTT